MQSEVLPARINALAVAVAVALFAIADRVSADEGAETVRIAVDYADLNLETHAGVKRLHYRLQRAARHACDLRPVRETGSLAVTRAARACYKDSLAAAVDAIGNERLTAFVRARVTTPSG